MTEKEIQARAAEATKEMLARLNDPAFKAQVQAGIAADIIAANAGVTYEEFAEKARAKKMGVKFMGGPTGIMRSPRVYGFYALVACYAILPFVLCPLWAWHEHDWVLLLGIVVNFVVLTTDVGSGKKSKIPSGIIYLLIAAIFWHFKGIHSYWTYFFFCAAWGMVWYRLADEYEASQSLKTVIENRQVFERCVATAV